jgi:hypothetical protein
MGERRIIDAPGLTLLLPRTDDPLGSVHLSARHLTTSTLGKEAAARRLQALARVILPRARFLYMKRLVCAIQALWRGVLSRRRAKELRDAGATEAVTRIQALTRGRSARGIGRSTMRQLMRELPPLERRLLFLPLTVRGALNEAPILRMFQWRAHLDCQSRALAFVPPAPAAAFGRAKTVFRPSKGKHGEGGGDEGGSGGILSLRRVSSSSYAGSGRDESGAGGGRSMDWGVTLGHLHPDALKRTSSSVSRMGENSPLPAVSPNKERGSPWAFDLFGTGGGGSLFGTGGGGGPRPPAGGGPRCGAPGGGAPPAPRPLLPRTLLLK